MAGNGKGGKGDLQDRWKRHRKVLRDGIHGSSPLFDFSLAVVVSRLIHEEIRGVSKGPWKRHLWRCRLHRARSQTYCHCHGRFLCPQETGNSLQIRRLNIFEFKRSISNSKWCFQHHNCEGLPITGTLQMTRSHFASGWCPPYLFLCLLWIRLLRACIERPRCKRLVWIDGSEATRTSIRLTPESADVQWTLHLVQIVMLAQPRCVGLSAGCWPHLHLQVINPPPIHTYQMWLFVLCLCANDYLDA